MSRGGTDKRETATERSQFKQAALRAGIEPQSGKRAIKGEHRSAVSVSPPWTHTESVDLDAHFEKSEPNACRWDYGLGVGRDGAELVIWVEPHPASSTGEVKRLVEKVKWLKCKLRLPEFKQLKDLTDATTTEGHIPYRWLHSGSLQIIRGSKEARTLALAGIDFPARQVKLPA